MTFPPSFLEEIRNRLSPSEIIGRRVNLKPKGRGEFSGLCCFHNEKTPSFTVSDDKGFYHCFGCGAHGDIIKFTMETQGLDFLETVKMLAAEAGLVMPKFDKADEERYKRINSLYDVMDIAAKWFEEQLQLSQGRTALDYIKGRGITQEIIKIFRLGFAPDNRNALKNALIEKGCSEQQLLDSGLLIKSDDGSTYDRFRGRLMFPIADTRGRVIAFGGRILGEGQPKYLNSPETELFHKGSNLYNLNLAREKAYEKGNIAVVEGYMDVIALYQAGIKNVVAPLGTALTENQLLMLWKLAKEPVICLDGDRAGMAAMAKAAENYLGLLKPGYSMRFAVLPAGQDPDDMIKNNGVAAMRGVLANAMPLADALWNVAGSGREMRTPEQKAAFESHLMKMVEKIADKTVQNYYRDHFRKKLWESKRGSKATDNSMKSADLRNSVNRFKGERERLEAILATTIFNHPEMLYESDIEEEFMHMDLVDRELDDIRQEISRLLADGNFELSLENLHSHLEKQGFLPKIKKLNADMFIDQFAKPQAHIDVARTGWNYFLSCYNFYLMEEEYKKAAGNATDETSQVVWELKKQKDMLKKLVEKEKMSYEAALEE